ncbi:retrovirus-related pol polyprotein from transposon TNT 1-94 [Tanacetum coccineum]|uniref:Retrovirus-related pol polyprotein from transposon TNT 1-94 n=1 Tax=Tanacetum coccineum TaxID=301880 RepID=A0ABQ5IWE0_9ASTR
MKYRGNEWGLCIPFESRVMAMVRAAFGFFLKLAFKFAGLAYLSKEINLITDALCKAFNDFNYLLEIDTNLFTFDIQGIRTYEEYELNNTVTRDLKEPWLDNRVPYQLPCCKEIDDMYSSLVAGLPSLTFHKDKNCSACEKEKHRRATFKIKKSFSINKCLHLLHMDLFGPVKPQTISYNKYTLVIVDEYSRYTWVFCLKKKSDAANCIMSFIKQMENVNDLKVKELRSDNGTKFRNHKLEEFCDEKGISQNFSSPCTPKQNGGEVVNTACYTQNRSIIVKRHGMTAYEVFGKRSPDISYFYVFSCPVHIHNYKDHLGKFDEKADDGFFLGYSLVAKAFRVFNIRRQEMEETYHVTFSKDDEAISQSNTVAVTLIPPLMTSSSEEVLEPFLDSILDLTHPADNSVPNEDHISEDEEDLGDAKDQNPYEPEASQTIPPPLSDDISNPHVAQDRWSREKHIELVNILSEPQAGVTTRSRVINSEAASAQECLYVNFLSTIESKKLIEALAKE